MKTLALTLCIGMFFPMLLAAQTVRVEVASNSARVEKAVAMNKNEVLNRTASFEGGEAAFYEFLLSEIKFPRKVKSDQNEVVAIASFYIQPDGSYSDIQIEESISKKFDEELIRVLNKMPLWSPALDNGEAIKQKWVQTIRIKLD
jgi:hypothetical protein